MHVLLSTRYSTGAPRDPPPGVTGVGWTIVNVQDKASALGAGPSALSIQWQQWLPLYSSLITYFFFFVFPYWPAGSPFLLKWIWTDVNDHVEYLSRATRDHRYCSGKPLAVRACSPLLDLRFLRNAL